MSKEKTKKQTPQQAFNQYLFDEIVARLRAVELYEKEVAGFSNQISQHVKDHRENAAKSQTWIDETNEGITSLLKALPDIEILKTQVKGLDELMNRSPFNNLVVKTQTEKILSLEKSYADTIRTFELKMKEQREDYHSHIRQLVTENEAMHFQMQKSADVARECSNKQAAELVQLRKSASLQGSYIVELEKRISAIEKKKPSGRPKKGA